MRPCEITSRQDLAVTHVENSKDSELCIALMAGYGVAHQEAAAVLQFK